MRRNLTSKITKRKRRIARNALAHALLIGLTVTAGAALITAPGLAEAVRGITGRRLSQAQVSQGIAKLYRKGHLMLTGSEGARKATITDKGRRVAYLHSIKPKKVEKNRWDETWFMVSFDIPTHQRKARDAFRQTLKELGFVQYHKSLYIHPYDYSSELDFISDYYEVHDSVFYFYSADIAQHDRLRKIFRL
jgi:DNA-binding transcriptional regulator PaaX